MIVCVCVCVFVCLCACLCVCLRVNTQAAKDSPSLRSLITASNDISRPGQVVCVYAFVYIGCMCVCDYVWMCVSV
jgi:hypothetical protein